MDSTSLAEIVASYKAATAAGGVMKIAAPNAHIRRLLQVTKVDTCVATHDSEADAVDSCTVTSDLQQR
jgi:anti-anti-sigma regulatory factor